jgi:hypothetical protein
MTTSPVFLRALLASAFSLAVVGCVTAEAPPAPSPAPVDAAVASDDPPMADGPADAAMDSAYGPGATGDVDTSGPALAGDLTFEWQTLLTSDVDAVETKGNAFLETSFKLYDQLLEEGGTSAAHMATVNATLKESADLYSQLTLAVDRLHADLSRPEIKQALPLVGDDGHREFDAVNELFASYKKVDAHAVAYDFEPEHGETAGLDGLPKPQRDALLLLDHLRDVSNDLAYVSHTVTDWVDMRSRLGSTDDEYAH